VHTIYIKDSTDECIATIFAEDGAIITKSDFLQALPIDSAAKNAYYDIECIVKMTFPIFVNKDYSLYAK
jgi:hypothetical protein